MRSSGRPPREGGFVFTLALLFTATIGMALAVIWLQQRAAQARLEERLLRTRLEREFPRELARLESAFASGPAGRSGPPRQALAVQALDNLLRRGRRERQALESQRQALVQLSRRSHDPAFQLEARRRVREINPRLNLARRWVRLLELQLLETFRRREARRVRIRPPPAKPRPPPPGNDSKMPAPIPPPDEAP